MAKIILKNVSKTYNHKTVLKNFNLEINEGEFIVIVGPSGSGKSTLLRIIAGLEKPTKGELLLDTKKISMVFQNYRLFNHMNVFENIAFGTKDNMQEENIVELTKYLKIDHLLDAYPPQLSGGEKQRVGIARALISNPDIVLMDEPLSNLDTNLKVQLKQLIKSLHKDLNTTFVYVTHDQNEAITLSDRLVVLNQGITQQIGTPLDIYTNPINPFVAKFTGMNIIHVTKNSVLYPIIQKENIMIGIRPEHINISTTGILCKVSYIENLGNETYVYTHIDENEIIIKTTDSFIENEFYITFDESKICFFKQA